MIRSLLALLTLFSAAGCVTFRGPQQLEQEVAAACNLGLVPRAAISMDTLALLMSPLPPALADAAWHLRWFHAGVYTVGVEDDSVQRIDVRDVLGADWQQLLYAQENFYEVLAMVRSRGECLTDLAILIYDGDELTIVRLDGRIERFIGDPESTSGLMDRIDALRTFFEHIGLAQRLLRATGTAHREHDRQVRRILNDSGWGPTREPLPEPSTAPLDPTGSPP